MKNTENTQIKKASDLSASASSGRPLPHLVLYVRALLRSLRSYESDMGGWKERLLWEIGYAEGEMGMPRRISKYDHPYEHGYYVATP